MAMNRLQGYPSTPAQPTDAPYDPNAAGRKCSTCGQRGRWQRLEWSANPGGWFCQCSPLLEMDYHPEMRHRCNAACVLGGAA